VRKGFALFPVRLWTIRDGYRVPSGRRVWLRMVYYRLTLWSGYFAYDSDNPEPHMEDAMPWSADTAMRQMWSELDKGVSNGEMMEFFKRHLQAAFDAGKNQEACKWREVAKQQQVARDRAYPSFRNGPFA